MNLSNLKNIFRDQGCDQIYVKVLAPNDNSKNQVYLGGSFDVLNVFPVSDIESVSAGDWKRERFKAKAKFFWIQEAGNLSHAPHSQFILYPKYPEVRLSGFLKGCRNAPSDLIASREANRVLFLAPDDKGRILAYVTGSQSALASEFHNHDTKEFGLFRIISLSKSNDTTKELLKELQRIHQLDWIKSKRLDSSGSVLECKSSNCGGYTLEAELGISPNGFSEPDFLGWEIKQFGVANFDKIYSKVITLMTPEPTGGDYKEQGVEFFLRNYGYPDKMGRPDRINFGGVHKVGVKHSTTNLTLKLIGFDSQSGKIRNANGCLALVTSGGVMAATWSFSSLLKHWNRKHHQACYVPSQMSKQPFQQYRYGHKVVLGEGTSFTYFLVEMNKGNIYYDPGIKMENASTKPKIKRRSQFRIKSGHLINLYSKSREETLV